MPSLPFLRPRRATLRRLLAVAGLLQGLALSAPALAQQTIRIAVTAGPHAQIAEVAKKVAERDGLVLKIIEFQDYIQPNAALDAGDVEANSYQHRPFLDSQIQARGYRISAVGNTVTFPIGFYLPKLVRAFQSPEVKALVEGSFAGSLVPAF